MENSFAVTGFVGKDASIHQLQPQAQLASHWPSAAMRRMAMKTLALLPSLMQRLGVKNENTSSFDRLVKGALLTVEGYFKPEEWQDAEGVKHNRVILVATKFYEAVEKENTPDSQQGKTQKDK